ncbi:ras-related protein Rab-30 isoform X1 [Cygnus olor]|uniref:ras-related protein Rab-30 isoform X1 n=1 Tax=Cygnus atratus TaxID=8868 RepID=UPI0015D5770E|nr:ras-related protein Rab-30 isoform X1 [Cygnus atratus]XP_040400271.1 ras-related protein Rab-30 isoform X1 [Cygnus olor]
MNTDGPAACRGSQQQCQLTLCLAFQSAKAEMETNKQKSLGDGKPKGRRAKCFHSSGCTLELQIWDTAGQERFRSITQSYYRSANALILTYDITCEESFRCLPEWLREIEQYASNKVITVLVGNKIDLADKREVSQQRAAEFSEAQDMYYLETSAKESDNVEKLFLDLACRLISEARQNTLVNNVSSPLPGEGKSISYLTCCNFN